MYTVTYNGAYIISRQGFKARVYGPNFKRKDSYDGYMPSKGGYDILQGQPSKADMDMIRKYQSMVS